MFTRICTLSFPDGATVTAHLSAEAPEDQISPTWTGAVDRLPPERLPARCNAAFLTTLFSNLGDDLGAAFSETTSGAYATWAE